MLNFDKDVFELMIEKVIIGEKDGKEKINPRVITFILKRGNEIKCEEDKNLTAEKNLVVQNDKNQQLGGIKMDKENNNWNLEKLKRQAIDNQKFDDFVLNQSGILTCKNLKVLDIGCSNGFKTEMLFDKYENIDKIVGIDLDGKAIDEARRRFVNNNKYTFETKDIYELETENKFDIICLSYVLQHLKNPELIVSKLKEMLTDRGVLIIKVPDDSFKFCYPDDEHLLKRIFDLYEDEIMKKQNITKFTDRHIGKKVYNYLKNAGYNNIQLYYNVTDTVNKSLEERKKLFKSSIYFRNTNCKNNIDDNIKSEMEELLNKMSLKFEDDNFYYVMSVLYYIARK